MSLVIYEINDPFAMDFGLEVKSFEFVEGKNLKAYIPSECIFFNQHGEELLGTILPDENSYYFVCYEVGEPISIIGYIIYMIISIVIGLLMNMIFAPDILDVSDNRPEYATYLWGKGATKSESMLNIPILLGKFPLYGNLISSKSKTEVKVQSIHTLYDNIHLLYGLSSNPIDNIESIQLNSIDAEEYKSTGDEEIAIFYTKGDLTQLPIQAFDDSYVEYPISNPTIYRYEALDNEPLLENELLLPDFTTEYYPSYVLERANHTIHDAVMSYDSLEELNGDITFLGVCNADGSGTLTDIDPSLETPFYIKISTNDITTTYRTVDCSSLTSVDEDYQNYCIIYDGVDATAITGEVEIPVTTVTEGVSFPSGSHILAFDSKNIKSPGTYSGASSEVVQYWDDTLYVEKVLDDVLQVNKRTNSVYSIEIGSRAQKALVTTNQISLGPSKWYMQLTEPGPAISYPSTSTFGVEDIQFTFAALDGFFYSNIRTSNEVKYGVAWISLQIDIYQKTGGASGTIVAASSLIPVDSSGNNRPPTLVDMDDKNPKYFIGCYKESVMLSMSLTDLLRFTPTGTDTAIQQIDSNPLIALTSDGYLESRDSSGNPYTYVVDIKQYSHGMYMDRGYFDVYYQPPEDYEHLHSDNTPEQLTIDLKLHRVTEINYKETLNYPGVSLLGISINATEAINNSLPDIQVVAESVGRVSDGTLTLSTWGTETTNNPAYLCLNILYDTFYGAGLGGSMLSSTKDTDFAELVDIDKFVEFAEYCDEPISVVGMEYTDTNYENEFVDDSGTYKPKRHTCNGVIDDEMSLWDTISKILKSSDAQPVLLGKKISLTWEQDFTDYDNPEDDHVLTPSVIFSSSNIVKGSLVETFQNTTDFVNSVTGEFYDADNNYVQTSCNLNLQDYDTSSDVNKSLQVDLFGITNRYRAYSKLRKAIRSSNISKHLYKFTSSLVGINISIGEVVGLNYELIDWDSAISNPETYTGRLVSTTSNTFKLDKCFKFIATKVYKILMFDPGSNVYQTYDMVSYNFTSGTTEVEVSTEAILPTSFPADSIYLIGLSENLYKDVIVLETTVREDKLVDIKAFEYFDELFDLTGYLDLITDYANYEYTEDNCAPQNFTVLASDYTEKADGTIAASRLPIIGSWDAPSIVADGNLGLERYEVYRRLGNMNNVTSGTEKQWVKLLEVSGNEASFIDDGMNTNTVYEYRVKPVFRNGFKLVTIPNAWSPTASIYLDFLRDFLIAPSLLSSTVVESETNPGYYDFTCEVESNRVWVHDPSHEFYCIWVTHKTSSNTDWLGPLGITLGASCKENDSTIEVSDITGLPTDGSGNVRCILALDYEDVVFIDGNVGNVLSIANMSSTYHSSLKINKEHDIGTVVRSRHHGFFPVRVIATTANNKLVPGLTNDTSTADTLYSYYSSDNTVRLVSPTDTDVINAVPLWNYEATEQADLKQWKVQSGSDRSVVSLKSIKLLKDSTTLDDFFSFEHGEFPSRYNDLLFCAAGLTNDFAPVSIYQFFRGDNLAGFPPVPTTVDGNFIIKLERIASTNDNFWVGAQHIIMSEGMDYGYTSFIKET